MPGLFLGLTLSSSKSGAPFVGIVLTGASQPEGTAIGTAIGTLSVVGGTGSYTFTITADPDSVFSITSPTLKNAAVFDFEAATSHSVTIHADNGSGSTFNGTFTVTVTNIDETPVNSVAPAISGTVAVGSALSCSTGTWTDMGSGSFTYQWKSAGSNIGGATASSFTLLHAQAGTTITCAVTATNSAGNASATSNTTASVTEAPSNTILPSISGTTTVGSTLTEADGTWTGSPGPTFTYQWLRGGVSIGSATSQTYVLVSGDLGTNISVLTTGTNSTGSASATSASVGPITSVSSTRVTDTGNIRVTDTGDTRVTN